MFRLQNNVPEVYPDRSRDFQMFCRLFDTSFNSVKQSIDTMDNISDTMSCDTVLLPLLKDKLGFKSSMRLGDKELRYILDAFPVIMRYKGSKRAIDYVTNLYSRIVSSISSSSPIQVTVENTNYIIEVSSEEAVVRSDLLFELLNYVLPTGYIIDYYVTKYQDEISQFYTHNELVYNTDFMLGVVSGNDVEAVYLNSNSSNVDDMTSCSLKLSDVDYVPTPHNINGGIKLQKEGNTDYKLQYDATTQTLKFYVNDEATHYLVLSTDVYGGSGIRAVPFENTEDIYITRWSTEEKNGTLVYHSGNLYIGSKQRTSELVIHTNNKSEYQEMPRIVNTFYIHKD